MDEELLKAIGDVDDYDIDGLPKATYSQYAEMPLMMLEDLLTENNENADIIMDDEESKRSSVRKAQLAYQASEQRKLEQYIAKIEKEKLALEREQNAIERRAARNGDDVSIGSEVIGELENMLLDDSDRSGMASVKQGDISKLVTMRADEDGAPPEEDDDVSQLSLLLEDL